MFKWLNDGWCIGTIVSRNTNRRLILDGEFVNFLVKYTCDGPNAPPAEHVLKSSDRLMSIGPIHGARHNQGVLLESRADAVV
jgi:hypothetical protein